MKLEGKVLGIVGKERQEVMGSEAQVSKSLGKDRRVSVGS